MSTPMQPDDPTCGLNFDAEELSDADLPEEWPQRIRDAFWSAVNAPGYAESQKDTLRFAQLLKALHDAP